MIPDAPTVFAGVSLFAGYMQTGPSITLYANQPRLNDNGFDNRAMSVRIPEGWRVRFYEHENFTGRYWTRDGGEYALPVPDSVSSVKILQRSIPSREPEGVMLFSGKNWSGKRLLVNTNQPNLSKEDFDNRATFVSISAGWQVRFYEHKNFTGDYWTRDAGKYTLPVSDSISSVKILRRPVPRCEPEGIMLFAGKDWSGTRLLVNNDQPSLSEEGFDDRTVSVRIPKGWQVRFYKHENFTGDYWTRDAGKYTLPVPDSISSVKILQRSCPVCETEGVMLFSGKDWSGTRLLVNADQPNLSKDGFDDRAVSVRIPERWQVRFYEHENFSGRYWTRTAGQYHLPEANVVSSIEILTNLADSVDAPAKCRLHFINSCWQSSDDIPHW